jgi:hypothetical protein
MEPRFRRGFTAVEKKELWDRWQRGESLKGIGRLLYVARTETDVSSNLHPYSIDPHAMIDQIMIDPRQSAADAERTRTEIKEETLFRGEIVRSLLYAPPPRLRLVSVALPRLLTLRMSPYPSWWISRIVS